MEVKKNLNNVQRKMMDAIYSEQFEVIARTMRSEREKGLADVQTKVVKDLLKNKDVKKMIDAGLTFFKLAEKLQPKLDQNGVFIENRLSHEPFIKFGRRYYGATLAGESEAVKAYEAETRRRENKLAEKKKEMRAKIWGTSASYEEADAEIKELLKDI